MKNLALPAVILLGGMMYLYNKNKSSQQSYDSNNSNISLAETQRAWLTKNYPKFKYWYAGMRPSEINFLYEYLPILASGDIIAWGDFMQSNDNEAILNDIESFYNITIEL